MSNRPRYGTYIAAAILSIIFIYPLWILILIAFEPVQFTFDTLYPSQIPLGLTLHNIISSFHEVDLVGPMIRSLEVAFMVGFIAIGLSIPAGYGLSKITSKISNKIIVLLFLINMMPGLVIAIPISATFVSIHLDNNVVGVALAQELVVLPLTVFIILGGYRALPKDLEHQARVDGAGFGHTFLNILMPLNKTPIMVAFLLAWMTSWDEFTYAVIIAPSAPHYSTFPVTLYNYVSRDLPLQSAAFSLIATIPVILLAAFMLKYLKGTYLSGGLVG